MKLIISLFVVFVIAACVYVFASNSLSRNNKKNRTLTHFRAAKITAAVVILLLIFIGIQMYRDATAQDKQCTTVHNVSSKPPIHLETAMDYFEQGNYEYDTGNCRSAIVDYARSIESNPAYPQAYNNRAYTYMRMHDYQLALQDLDAALALNPNYIQALMNRGDIHNYYYAIDRRSAVSDYEKVVSLGGKQGTSVCGHLFLARHNGWNLRTVLDLPGLLFSNCY